MILEKIFSIVTPLMGVAFIGFMMIAYGFVNPSQQNNVLQFMFGIPILLGAVAFHFLVRRALNRNTLRIWIAEAIIVALMWYVFERS